MVLEKGQIQEFDIPFKLLTNNEKDMFITKENSIFSQMVLDSGVVKGQAIFNAARTKYFSLKKKFDQKNGNSINNN